MCDEPDDIDIDASSNKYSASFEDLPEDVIEYIFMNLSPYGDLQHCRQVNKQWRRISSDAMRQMQRSLQRCQAFEWFLLQQPVANNESMPPLLSGSKSRHQNSITERCSHSACYHPGTGCVYVFGGCTAAYTTFNDLWKFDLWQRVWSRPMPTGNYPTPKACASLVEYKNKLLLFGGWSKSSPNPIHQTAMFYNELHAYDVQSNTWTHLGADNAAPHLAGHSSSMIHRNMVVFGGSHGNGSSDHIWVYDVEANRWSSPTTNLPKPTPRYGQSQIVIDDKHLLIIGGCGGPNLIMSDVWLLTMEWNQLGEPAVEDWTWEELTVLNPHLSAPLLWSHPACRVGPTKALILSKSLRCGALSRGQYRALSMSPRLSIGAASTNVRSNWVPPQGNLIPPRQRKLISSRSLDENNGPSTSSSNNSRPSDRSSGSSGASSCGASHNAELQRARSIPAIIVGEIPQLVVTEDVGVQQHQQQPAQHVEAIVQQPEPAQQRQSKCIAMAASSLLPYEATEVEPPPPSPNVEFGGSGAHHRPPHPPSSARFSGNGVSPLHSVLPNGANGTRSASQSRNWERQMEALRRMDEYIRTRQTSSNGAATSAMNFSQTQMGTRMKFRPSSPPPKSKRQSLDAGQSSQSADANSGEGNASSQEDCVFECGQQHGSVEAAASCASASPHRNTSADSPSQISSSLDSSCSSSNASLQTSATSPAPPRNPMSIYLLDLADVLNAKSVSWSVLEDNWDAPEDTILYSLVKGRGELVLFGGMRSQTPNDCHALDVTPFSHTITNETYILRPPVQF